MSKSPYCFKDKVSTLLSLLKTQTIPEGKKTAYAYVKRSLERAEDGYKTAIIFDTEGKIASAASYISIKGSIFIETLGSIGKFNGKFTPGQAAIYDIMKQAQLTATKSVTAYASADSIAFYEKCGFVSSPKDGRLLIANEMACKRFIKMFEALTKG